VTTNSERTGNAYQVLLVSGDGRLVARVSAQLPSTKLNQSIDLPLTSVSAARVYYLDGDTDIRWLAPDGSNGLAAHIAAGSTGELAFAVSPDDAQIAVTVLTEAGDPSQTTMTTSVGALSGGGKPHQLLGLSGASAYRWAAGWQRGALVLALRATLGCGEYISTAGFAGGGGGGAGGGGGGGAGGVGGTGGTGPQGGYPYDCAGAYHLVSPVDGRHLVDVCQAPASFQSPADDVIPVGLTTSSGVACLDYAGGYGVSAWDGRRTVFSRLPRSYRAHCYSAPDASKIACSGQEDPVQSTLVINRDGSTRGLGGRYSVLGWMDADCVLVSLGRHALGVVETDGRLMATLALDDADQASMVGVLAGS